VPGAIAHRDKMLKASSAIKAFPFRDGGWFDVRPASPGSERQPVLNRRIEAAEHVLSQVYASQLRALEDLLGSCLQADDAILVPRSGMPNIPLSAAVS
jgi:hypothetical protein